MSEGEDAACEKDAYPDGEFFAQQALNKSTVKKFLRQGHQEYLCDDKFHWAGKCQMKLCWDTPIVREDGPISKGKNGEADGH